MLLFCKLLSRDILVGIFPSYFCRPQNILDFSFFFFIRLFKTCDNAIQGIHWNYAFSLPTVLWHLLDGMEQKAKRKKNECVSMFAQQTENINSEIRHLGFDFSYHFFFVTIFFTLTLFVSFILGSNFFFFFFTRTYFFSFTHHFFIGSFSLVQFWAFSFIASSKCDQRKHFNI